MLKLLLTLRHTQISVLTVAKCWLLASNYLWSCDIWGVCTVLTPCTVGMYARVITLLLQPHGQWAQHSKFHKFLILLQLICYWDCAAACLLTHTKSCLSLCVWFACNKLCYIVWWAFVIECYRWGRHVHLCPLLEAIVHFLLSFMITLFHRWIQYFYVNARICQEMCDLFTNDWLWGCKVKERSNLILKGEHRCKHSFST